METENCIETEKCMVAENCAETEKNKMAENGTDEPVCPKSHLTKSIIATMICMPLGAVALVRAAQVNGLHAMGNHEEAKKASELANKWCKYSFILWGILLAVYVGIVIICAFLGAAMSCQH